MRMGLGLGVGRRRGQMRGNGPPPADPWAVSSTYSAPSLVTIGEQRFGHVGRRPKPDYAYRQFDRNGVTVHRYEVHQGDRVTLASGGAWDDETNVDRSQMDAGNTGTAADIHPANWQPSMASDPLSGQVDYVVDTEWTWTPILGFPSAGTWDVINEIHHRNQSLDWVQHAPIRILTSARGAARPVFVAFGNWPSLAAAQTAKTNRTQPNEVEQQIIANIEQYRTYRFRDRFRPHMTDGIYQLWLDDVLVFERTGVMVGYPWSPHYRQKGIYRETTPLPAISEYTYPNPARIFARIPVTETVATPTPPAAPATNILTAPSNFSNAAWIKTRATVTNAGAANQALMETAVTNNHYVTQTVAKPAVAAKYRLQFDAIGDLGRSWVMGSVYNADYSGECSCFFDVANNVIGNHFAYGGPQETGTSTVTDMGGGVKRCTMDFIHDTSTSLILTLFIASADDTTNYAGDVTKGLRLTNVKIGTI